MATRIELLRWLVGYLAEERGEAAHVASGAAEGELWDTFRALVNTRQPLPATDEFFAKQDHLLKSMIAEAGIVSPASIPPSRIDGRIATWRGDITTLAADAIVNAANSQMLGYWIPGHYCIDNAIHTFAGVQLRIECDRIMRAQGHPEPTAQAKTTPAYNLPARWIIHTVGPIAGGMPLARHREELARCYRACLDAATGLDGCRTIAFCCISTGVFGFPHREAAEIAVRTVRAWLDAHSDADLRVVFNTFLEEDDAIYRELLA